MRVYNKEVRRSIAQKSVQQVYQRGFQQSAPGVQLVQDQYKIRGEQDAERTGRMNKEILQAFLLSLHSSPQFLAPFCFSSTLTSCAIGTCFYPQLTNIYFVCMEVSYPVKYIYLLFSKCIQVEQKMISAISVQLSRQDYYAAIFSNGKIVYFHLCLCSDPFRRYYPVQNNWSKKQRKQWLSLRL